MRAMQKLYAMSRAQKRLFSVCVDVGMILLSLHVAIWLRLEEWFTITTPQAIFGLGIVTVLTVVTYIKLGLYRAVLHYLGLHALVMVVVGALASGGFMAAVAYYLDLDLPRSVPMIYALLLALLSGGARMIFRGLVFQSHRKRAQSVLIYGAGKAGRQLAQSLQLSGQYHVAAFIDEDQTLCGSTFLGLQVYSVETAFSLIRKKGVSLVLLAVPAASYARRKQIIEQLAPLPVEVRSVPALQDIVSGKAKIDEFKEVAIDDLLGREPVPPQQSLLEANIKDKVVMVTGAGGSIGSELCRQIIRNRPSALVLFELSEFGLYQIHQELLKIVEDEGLELELYPLLGSVQREHRLLMAMEKFSVQTVYHAAAYKHVPLVENNVVEGVRNNVFGTFYTAKAAIEAKVESFVLISTDKAVRPTNVMGTTKRLAELGLQALAEQDHETRFCMVRFGNVLGSSGSVVPVFKKQIANRLPITVTHPDITRYFMTIPEAAQLVIQAGAMGRGGDVFVLDMGEPVKIVQLAENLINLSGLTLKNDDNPSGDIEIRYTGLRPGEKLYEELLIGDDNIEQTAHSRIMTALEDYLSLDVYLETLNQLDTACHQCNYERIREIMIDTPTGFSPVDGIEDLIWKQEQVDKDFELMLGYQEVKNDIGEESF
ncbi:polysaccharide biosynthesis protein [Vibrio chaetopteri]|uniref:polysaccharide biosynthesis protein n=1 Tax=Vibrio chaetopteri TaxID=3016528 RepID=UPI003AB1DEC1